MSVAVGVPVPVGMGFGMAVTIRPRQKPGLLNLPVHTILHESVEFLAFGRYLGDVTDLGAQGDAVLMR